MSVFLDVVGALVISGFLLVLALFTAVAAINLGREAGLSDEEIARAIKEGATRHAQARMWLP